MYTNNSAANPKYHDTFYTDSTIATQYMNYVTAVVNRYKASSAIFAWELANEARCAGTGQLPQSSACAPATITTWTDNMSHAIKQLDPNHMVTTGYEGMFNRPSTSGSIFEYDGGSGQDFDALMALDAIDFGTSHLYLSNTSASYMTLSWTQQWLQDHNAVGVNVGKPVIQEEYGVTRTDTMYNTQQVYDAWHQTILGSQAINGDMTWGSLIVDEACPGNEPYAICPADADYADLVTNWVASMNGKAGGSAGH